MKLFRQWRAVACAVGASAMLLGLGAAPAQSKPLEQVHFHDVGSEIQEDCEGITLRYDFDVKGSFLLNQRGPNGLIYGRDKFRGTESWTNVANDMTATGVFTRSTHDLKVTDNGDGALTILVQATFNSKFFFPQGFRFHDRGMVRFELLIDTKGTPDPSDDTDEFLGDVKVAGQSDTAGRDFCADMLEFLG